jgi:hypothetical protein
VRWRLLLAVATRLLHDVVVVSTLHAVATVELCWLALMYFAAVHLGLVQGLLLC